MFESYWIIILYSLKCLYSTFILYLKIQLWKFTKYFSFHSEISRLPFKSWPNYFLHTSRSCPHWLVCDGSCLGMKQVLPPASARGLSSDYSALLRIETTHKLNCEFFWFSGKHLLQDILKIRWLKQQNLLLTNLDHLECSQVSRILFKASRHFFLSNTHSP